MGIMFSEDHPFSDTHLFDLFTEEKIRMATSAVRIVLLINVFCSDFVYTPNQTTHNIIRIAVYRNLINTSLVTSMKRKPSPPSSGSVRCFGVQL